MQHTPKTEWESVKVLADGMSSHPKAPTVMRFKLPNANLAATDAENASILGPHFEKVYTNHRKIDWAVLDDILQRLTMLELDAKISCLVLTPIRSYTFNVTYPQNCVGKSKGVSRRDVEPPQITNSDALQITQWKFSGD